MTQIFSPYGKRVRSWDDDGAFFNHISAGELLEDHPEIDATHWIFVVFPPEMVPDLCLNLKQKPVPRPLKEAYEQHLGVIEICKGNYWNPVWIPLELGLDPGRLKKDWYLECCHQHGYVIREGEGGQ